MTRNEFLDGLRRALAGKVDVETIEETIRYYEDYIDIQIKTGKSEKEVLENLGKPQLIAKSIVNAKRNGQENGYPGEVYEEEKHQRYSRSRMGDKGVHLILNMPRWLASFLALLLLFVFIWFVVSVLSFFAPILIPVAIVLVILAIVKNRS